MKKIMIATPSHSGDVDCYFHHAMIDTLRLGIKAAAQGMLVDIIPITVPGDAVIQRARNYLLEMAVTSNVDDLIFIDADIEWKPEWIFSLITREEDVIGLPARKKTDEAEIYNIKTRNYTPDPVSGLLEVESVGTGLLRLSRKVFVDIFNKSPEYRNDGKLFRAAFEVGIVDGELYSEDTVLCHKLRQLGYKVWVDPSMTCVHIGKKRFEGDFNRVLEFMRQQEGQKGQPQRRPGRGAPKAKVKVKKKTQGKKK